MKYIYFYALRDRLSGVLIAFVYNMFDDVSIRDFYLNLLAEVDFKKSNVNILDYDVCKLGYYDIINKQFVTDDNVLFSVTADMLKGEKKDEV